MLGRSCVQGVRGSKGGGGAHRGSGTDPLPARSLRATRARRWRSGHRDAKRHLRAPNRGQNCKTGKGPCSSSRTGPKFQSICCRRTKMDQVVFFCGAGISCPAGLPLFGSLVNRVYRKLRVQRDAVQHAAFRAKRLDTALGLLEGNDERKREAVRRAVAEILSPNLALRDATTTHEALLTAEQDPQGPHPADYDQRGPDLRSGDPAKSGRTEALPGAAGTDAQEPLGRTGVSPRATGTRTRPQQPGQPCIDERRLWTRVPQRALGSAIRRRTVPQLHGVLRRIQHRRSGAALHDGLARGRTVLRRNPPGGIRIRSVFEGQGRGVLERVASQERDAHPVPSALAACLPASNPSGMGSDLR